MYSKMPTEFFFQALDGQLFPWRAHDGLLIVVKLLVSPHALYLMTAKFLVGCVFICSLNRTYIFADACQTIIVCILPQNALRRDCNGK